MTKEREQLPLWERADTAVNTVNHNINVAGKIFNHNVNTYNEQVRASFLGDHIHVIKTSDESW